MSWFNYDPVMIVYKFDCKVERIRMKCKDFSPPDAQKHLYKDFGDGFRIYYEAKKYSKAEAKTILDQTVYGVAWLVKMDESGQFIEFDIKIT